jgi:hypothetical protein
MDNDLILDAKARLSHHLWIESAIDYMMRMHGLSEVEATDVVAHAMSGLVSDTITLWAQLKVQADGI